MNNDCSFRVQNVAQDVENLHEPSTPKRDETDFLHFPQRSHDVANGLGQGHCRREFKEFSPSNFFDVSLCAWRV